MHEAINVILRDGFCNTGCPLYMDIREGEIPANLSDGVVKDVNTATHLVS